jgi:serine/threonine protein kinase
MRSNSEAATVNSGNCNFVGWKLAVLGDESDRHFAGAVAHVEQCPVCQHRIGSMTDSDMRWWGEAKKSWLECELPIAESDTSLGTVIVEVQPEMPEDSRIEYETVALSFLDAPRHPELLGRLGRYDIERVVGTGGMGIVLKAHDSELHRVVAIKILAAHLANNASARKRFAREAQAAAAVLHPNVIPIYNVDSTGKLPFLVMQYVAGRSLQSKVDNFGPLHLAETLRIAKQTAAGLAAAHDQGLVHRDVKPANILLEENVDRVLLSDFGLARAVDDASLTRTGVVAGTPHYMSPEQARGDAIDTRSDQFSLGSVIYFVLTGRPPFRASGAMGVLNRICTDEPRSIDQVNPDVPIEVEMLVERLMSKKASDRFDSMHVVEAEIERLLAALQSGGLSLGKGNFNRRQQTSGSSKAINKAFVALTIMAIFFLTAMSYFSWQSIQFSQQRTRMNELPRIREMIRNSIAENQQLEVEIAFLQQQLNELELKPAPYGPIGSSHFDQAIETIEIEIRAMEAQLPPEEYGEKE